MRQRKVLLAMMLLGMGMASSVRAEEGKQVQKYIEATYQSEEQVLEIQADVVENLSDWKMGALEVEEFPIEKLKGLFGAEEGWKESDKESDSWSYKALPVHISNRNGVVEFDNEWKWGEDIWYFF